MRKAAVIACLLLGVLRAEPVEPILPSLPTECKSTDLYRYDVEAASYVCAEGLDATDLPLPMLVEFLKRDRDYWERLALMRQHQLDMLQTIEGLTWLGAGELLKKESLKRSRASDGVDQACREMEPPRVFVRATSTCEMEQSAMAAAQGVPTGGNRK